MARPNGELARLVAEYGSQHKERGTQTGAQPDAMAELVLPTSVATLMQDEDRELGQVRFATYKRYFLAGGGIGWMPWIMFLVILGEGLHGAPIPLALIPTRLLTRLCGEVANQLALGWWSGQTFRNWTHNQYIALYSGIGIGSVFISFLIAFTFWFVPRRVIPSIDGLSVPVWRGSTRQRRSSTVPSTGSCDLLWRSLTRHLWVSRSCVP